MPQPRRQVRIQRVIRRAILAATPLVAGCPCPSLIWNEAPASQHLRDKHAADAGVTPQDCLSSCPPGSVECFEVPLADGGPGVTCGFPGVGLCSPFFMGVEGRRPDCLRDVVPRCDSVASYWKAATEMEAASVPAFEHLADELRVHGAPDHLIRAALRSAGEEHRHAAMSLVHATAAGVAPALHSVDKGPIRSLLELARENAREGCVGETWAATVATWQAEHAGDDGMRRTFVQIARDERRHAALAWSVDAWVRSQLDDASRVVLDGELARAAKNLREQVGHPPAELVATLGLPSPGVASVLLDELHAGSWTT